MADVLGDRIAWLIEDRRTSQSAVARDVGTSQPTIGRLISGETRQTGKLLELARALRTTPEYLVGESDDPEPNSTGNRNLEWKGLPPERDPDIVEIAEIDARFGAGGVIMDEHASPEMRSFSRTWLRQLTTTPAEDLYWARTRGDSMAPTIGDGEPVLIDRRQDSVQDADLIWAFAWGDVGAIKRLRPMPDGTVKVLSDNPAVPPDVAHDDEIHVFGRVVAVVKKL